MSSSSFPVFNKGDWVKRIGTDYREVRRGEVYRVAHAASPSRRSITLEGVDGYYDSSQFEYVENAILSPTPSPKFQPGDLVARIGPDADEFMKQGHIYRVSSYHPAPSLNEGTLSLHHQRPTTIGYSPRHFELVSRPIQRALISRPRTFLSGRERIDPSKEVARVPFKPGSFTAPPHIPEVRVWVTFEELPGGKVLRSLSLRAHVRSVDVSGFAYQLELVDTTAIPTDITYWLNWEAFTPPIPDKTPPGETFVSPPLPPFEKPKKSKKPKKKKSGWWTVELDTSNIVHNSDRLGLEVRVQARKKQP
jgi:hypothetical protein